MVRPGGGRWWCSKAITEWGLIVGSGGWFNLASLMREMYWFLGTISRSSMHFILLHIYFKICIEVLFTSLLSSEGQTENTFTGSIRNMGLNDEN